MVHRRVGEARFDGAWTGNRPDAKPEDYGSRAVPLEQFLSVLGAGIEEHNLRSNRRSEVAMGRSFAEVFDEAYADAAAPMARALKDAGAKLVHLAGRPAEREADWRAAGIDAFVFAGCNAITPLEQALSAAGG
jgi:hypothetical protein